MTRRTRSSQGVNALKLTHYHGGYRNIDDTRRYDSCGLAASNRSIGSHTNAVCTTCRPANWIAASAAGEIKGDTSTLEDLTILAKLKESAE